MIHTAEIQSSGEGVLSGDQIILSRSGIFPAPIAHTSQPETKDNMKTLFRLLACAGLSLAAASLSFAASGPQHWQTLRKEAQFKELKAGDKIAYVCNQCQTVSEVSIDSPMQAMEHCKEGATVACPMCKKKVKVVTKGPPKNPSIESQVTYVNEKGEECMFIAKVGDKK